jgi:3-oxoacyl-[acyl-carrier protein] reductase
MNTTPLANKVALVTGGARDIGRAVSLKLAGLGASVAVNYYDNPAQAEETVRAIVGAGGKAVAIQGDVTIPESVDRLVERVHGAFGPSIHILVNLAGGLVARKPIAEMDQAFWGTLITLNLTSVFTVTKAVLPSMPDGGVIVNFSSQAARDGGGPGAIAYATAKGGVMTMTRGMAKELGPRRIRVNAVAPGMINTTFHDTFTKPEVRQRVAAMTPLGREGEAREVANLVAFLATEESSFVNGATIDINGGIFFS